MENYFYDPIHREAQRIHKRLLELINEFSRIAGHKINIQRLVVFQYTNTDLLQCVNVATQRRTITQRQDFSHREDPETLLSQYKGTSGK